jgi:hypothetical protein
LTGEGLNKVLLSNVLRIVTVFTKLVKNALAQSFLPPPQAWSATPKAGRTVARISSPDAAAAKRLREDGVCEGRGKARSDWPERKATPGPLGTYPRPRRQHSDQANINARFPREMRATPLRSPVKCSA